ncbi:MAG TPA: hypothetical protein VGH89_11000 [Pseudonocardia sp.]|jgi:hypothetical protein
MVFRERRPTRHRAADGYQPEVLPGLELEAFLAALEPGENVAPPGLTGRISPAKPLALRLPEAYAEQLRELADERGVTMSALLASWVMERLGQELTYSVVTPAPRSEFDPVVPPAAEARQPATASLPSVMTEDLIAPLSPVDQLNPIGELTPVSPANAAPVTPLFRNPPPAHASEDPPKGPRHRAPEPVTSLHSRRKF